MSAPWKKFKGITLGFSAYQATPRTIYRIRVGRVLGLTGVGGLTPEWRDAYIRWYVARGKLNQAQALRVEWMAATKYDTVLGA